MPQEYGGRLLLCRNAHVSECIVVTGSVRVLVVCLIQANSDLVQNAKDGVSGSLR